MLCGGLDGRGVWRRMDTYIYMIASLHWRTRKQSVHTTHLSGLASCGGESDDVGVVGTLDPDEGLEE